jgi:hypothetical protein
LTLLILDKLTFKAARPPPLLPAWRAVILDVEDIARSIDGDPAALRFTIGDLELKPFFETYGHHSVYVDVTLE